MRLLVPHGHRRPHTVNGDVDCVFGKSGGSENRYGGFKNVEKTNCEIGGEVKNCVVILGGTGAFGHGKSNL